MSMKNKVHIKYDSTMILAHTTSSGVLLLYNWNLLSVSMYLFHMYERLLYASIAVRNHQIYNYNIRIKSQTIHRCSAHLFKNYRRKWVESSITIWREKLRNWNGKRYKLMSNHVVDCGLVDGKSNICTLVVRRKELV